MSASKILVGLTVIMLMINIIYYFENPSNVFSMVGGGIASVILGILTIGSISGVQIMGSGISDESLRLIFGMAFMLNVIFSLNIGGFQIGLGLMNNVYYYFSNGNDIFGGIGTVICGAMSGLMLICAMFIIAGVE